jgi:hypothetical protein
MTIQENLGGAEQHGNEALEFFEASNDTRPGDDVEDVDAEFGSRHAAAAATGLFGGPSNLDKLAEDMNEMNIYNKTRSGYQRAGETFMEWMKHFEKHEVKDVTIEQVKMYQMHVLKTGKPKQGRTVISASYIAGIRTAIEYLFEENNVPLPEGYAEQMKTFGRGMKRRIVKLSAASTHSRDPLSTGTLPRRKGAATHCTIGCTAGPSIAVCLRCDWSMGLQDRYFCSEGAADMYVGRIVAGLPQFSKEFATPPSHL